MTPQNLDHIQWQCQQLLNRVAQLMDAGEWHALAACYTEDAMLFRPSDPNHALCGRQAILDSFLARPARISCHFLTNTVFEVRSPQAVVAHSRVLLMTGAAGGKLPATADSALLAGDFTDHLVLQDGRWLIQRREGGIQLRHDCLVNG